MDSDVFIYDYAAKHQFFGIFVQRFSSMFEFTEVDPLAVNVFPYLCDKLAGPFESRYFAFYTSEIRLLCICEVFRNET